MRCMIRVAGWLPLTIVAVLEALNAFLTIVSPLVLQELVKYLYTASSDDSAEEGVLWALAFLGMGIGGALFSAHQVQLAVRLGFKVRAGGTGRGRDVRVLLGQATVVCVFSCLFCLFACLFWLYARLRVQAHTHSRTHVYTHATHIYK